METIIGGAPRRVIQVRAGRSGGMTNVKRRRFFEHFAATCNATISARAAGLSLTTVYTHKRRDPAFAAAWEDAKQAGRERLEEALIARSLLKLEATEFDAAAVAVELVDQAENDEQRAGSGRAEPAPTGLGSKVALVDVQVALALVKRCEDAGRRGRGGRRPQSLDEIEKALGAKLDSLARRLDGCDDRGVSAGGEVTG